MIKVQEAIENKLIDKEIDSKCPWCGAEMVFSNSLDSLECSNSECYHKIAVRLYNMSRRLQTSELTMDDCIRLCKELELVTPFQALMYEDMQGIEDISDIVEKLQNLSVALANEEPELWKICWYSDIEYLANISYKIFREYNSFTEAFDEIEAGGVALVAEQLGMGSECSGMALRIFTQLLEYKDELMFGEDLMKVSTNVNDSIGISVSGEMKYFLNREEFMQSIRARYPDKTFRIDTVIKDKTDILVICGDSSGSSKFHVANKINEKYRAYLISSGKVSKSDFGKNNPEDKLRTIGTKIRVISEANILDSLDIAFKDIRKN